MTLSASPTDFTCANVGANTVTLTVTDNNSNTATCTATVTMEDNVAPVAVCQNLTVNVGTTLAASQVDNGSTDACGIANLSVNPSTFNTVGVTSTELTVTDNNGNTSTCTATITVEDTNGPTAICQDITIQLDASGNASITAADIDNGSFDNQGPVTLSASPTSFTCADVGANTVTLTVTDANSNTATCTATVTVEDNVAPIANCKDITIGLDAGGTVSITAVQVSDGSNDNERAFHAIGCQRRCVLRGLLDPTRPGPWRQTGAAIPEIR